jgi:hypothetical protein
MILLGRRSISAVTSTINSDSALDAGSSCFLNQNRRIGGVQVVFLLNQGSTAHRLENFGKLDLRARLRSEYLPAEKDNISREGKQRESCKEIRSSAKEELYKPQCRFRIEPEISHDLPPLLRRYACDGGTFWRMPAEVNRGGLASLLLVPIGVTV